MHRTGIRVVVVFALLGAVLIGAPTASAGGPVDWTVISTFIGADGEDIPLRVGSHDTPVAQGFGARHIRDGHEEVPPDTDIELVLSGSNRNCAHTASDDRSRCALELGDRTLFVVFTERVDDGSGDGRPVGIITAYYSPRGCPC